ncbi:LuxR C-terminal-related transcriptional regulator [Pelagibacterium sp.]|uniref:LuxR C-terminal-related transcriptional regulator n=1 Tax=Pelagibacterium sp. TaxID=1967288 RepID=UPI003A944552
MPLYVVSESRLLRDMLLSTFENNDFKVSGAQDALSDLPVLSDQDLVVFQSSASEEDLIRTAKDFRQRRAQPKLIVVSDQPLSTPGQKELVPLAQAAVPAGKSAAALLAVVRVVRNGYRMLPMDMEELPEPAEVVREGAPLRNGVSHQPHPAGRPELEAEKPSALTSTAAAEAVLAHVTAAGETHGLSMREQLILSKLLKGATNKTIANDLGICEATVKVHLRTCYRKIGVKNRTQAAIWVTEQMHGA